MQKCELCDYQTDNKLKLSKHVLHEHKLKNQWAQENGYKLLRFWEDDINNNIKQVKNILLESCKK